MFRSRIRLYFRFALPASRFCIAIIAKEHKETFLEAILNICRQWYQERDKVLGSSQTIKNSARPRFIAFMAYLTEMFCQLKRRQLQLRTKCDGVRPKKQFLIPSFHYKNDHIFLFRLLLGTTTDSLTNCSLKML